MSAKKQGPDAKPTKKEAAPKAKNPIKICDTTFRDGHQSSFATRLRMEDMEPIAAEMDKMGFHAMEVWVAPHSTCARVSSTKTRGRESASSRD